MRASSMLAAAALLTSAAHAQTLTYDQALRVAIANAPGVVAGQAGVTAAQSDARAAGSLPDPRLSVGIDNYPVSGPPSFSLTRDDMTMGRVGLQQDLTNLAKRHAAQAQARAAIATAEASQVNKLRGVRLGTGQAWIDLAYAERRLAAINVILRSLRVLPSATRAAVAAGTVRPGQTIGTDQAIAALEDRRDELLAAVARARAMLARWTGVSAPQVAGELPALELTPARLRAALPQHPDIISADAGVRRAEADVDAARAEKRPDWGVELAYQRRDPRYGDMVSAGVSMSLPLFARSRQNPRIAADRKSTRLNSSHVSESRMPSSA